MKFIKEFIKLTLQFVFFIGVFSIPLLIMKLLDLSIIWQTAYLCILVIFSIAGEAYKRSNKGEV